MSINTEHVSWEYFVIYFVAALRRGKAFLHMPMKLPKVLLKRRTQVRWPKKKKDCFWIRELILMSLCCITGSEDGRETAGFARGETSALPATEKSPSWRGEAPKKGAKVCEKSFCVDFVLSSHTVFSSLFSVLIDSDITTLTSASYQPSIPLHSGQHLLSLQGGFNPWNVNDLEDGRALKSYITV